MDDLLPYEKMRRTYEECVARTTDHFRLEDTGSSYTLDHRRLPLLVELPETLERGATTTINMMAPVRRVESPEEIMAMTGSFIHLRDFLRQQGYRPFEQFAVYDDGVEYIYHIPTESPDDLTRIVHDFGEFGGLKL